MHKRVTQRDVAQAAGVDVSTVSLALNQHPRIPEATRLRIYQIAQSLGYRADPGLSALAATRWRGRQGRKGLMLGFLCDRPQEQEIEVQLYRRGIARQAAALGYSLQHFASSDYPDPAEFWRLVHARGLRGMLVGQSRVQLPTGFYQHARLPLVHCGYLHEVPADTVRPDVGAAVNLAYHHLAQTHKRIAFFLQVDPTLQSDRQILGAATALARYSPRHQLRVVHEHAALQRFNPEAIVCINEKHADELARRCPQARQAERLSLHTLPPFTDKHGVDLRLEEIGQAAVNLLELKMRQIPMASPSYRQQLLIEPRWLGG